MLGFLASCACAAEMNSEPAGMVVAAPKAAVSMKAEAMALLIFTT
jgi:hypothetical protein